MPAETAPRTPRVRLYELDLLRFLAAMAVLLYHYTGSRGGPFKGEKARELFDPVSALTQFGYLGVELFFLISGFVILMSAWGRSMADFTVSRITRLYPAYWLAVLMIGAIHLTTGMGRGKPETIIPNLTMFQQGMGIRNASGVFWTLWAEMHFYALISLLVLTGITYRRCLTFMTTWTVLAIFAKESGNDLLQSVLIPTYAPYFIAGMALYLIHRFGPTLMLWLLVAFSWACSIRYALPAATEAPYSISRADAWPAIAVLTTLVYALVALIATGKLSRLRWKRLATLGALTYPTYLIHYELGPVIARFLYPTLQPWAVVLIITATVLAAAYLINKLVEEPAARWLKPRLKDSFARLATTEPGQHRHRRARHTEPPTPPGPPTPPAPAASTPRAPPPPTPAPEARHPPITPTRPMAPPPPPR
ncbi:acyltransferase family protein [Actinomadura hibisca]|uniref:acyltransferase family protein n=1 Tax=Actinomadura hibisca TaxID=68565 RepID=UPI0008326B65|nr:acyltransferase [Actinomadura hibisca]